MITSSPIPEGVGWSPAVHSTARDLRISRRALGLLVELLSYPPGWDMNADKLAKLGREGREATRKAMRELEDAGYVIHLVYRGSGGRMLTVSFTGNLPEVARALADAWLEENPHLDAKEKASSHRGTANRASVDQASVHRASADRTSVDWASSIRQTEETERKTDNKIDKNTAQPTPTAAAAPPDWVAPASGEGVVVQEEGEGKTQDARKRAEVFVEDLPFLNPPGRGRKQRLQAQVAAAIAAGWSEDGLMAVCMESLNSADDRVNCWLYRLKPAQLGPAPKAGQDDFQSKLKVPKPRQAPDGHRTWTDPDASAYRAPKGGHVGWQNPTDSSAYDGEF